MTIGASSNLVSLSKYVGQSSTKVCLKYSPADINDIKLPILNFFFLFLSFLFKVFNLTVVVSSFHIIYCNL